MPREMLSVLAQKIPMTISNLSATEFDVIIGHPVGAHIVQVSISSNLEFPNPINDIVMDLPPFLEAAWKDEEVIKSSVECLNNRKRKIVEISDIIHSS
ncbi:MAG: hypothetical protein EXX96DRAFT_627367 [Benjaminiella poitrasii]|nr:MAG: hypothetical protein EXX96DRAFT_627367 [Benjaminiella poitrasii]